MESIERWIDPNKALDGEKEMAKDWTDHEQSSRAQKVSRDSVARQWVTSAAQQWRVAGCADAGAPYVARALLAMTDMPFFPVGSEMAKVAAAFLDTEHGAGARGLFEGEIAKLKAIRDSAPPPAAKK